MNRRGFVADAAGCVVAMTAGLLGALGLRGQDASPSLPYTPAEFETCKTAGALYRWNGKKWACYEPDPAKGEEYCPLGHVQKPSILFSWLSDKQIAGATLHVCSVCSVVYVSLEKKAV